MNVFRNAIAAAGRVLQTVAGITVSITRGAQTTSNVVAIPGRTQFTVEDSEGQRSRRHVRDFLIDAADYQIGGTATEPASGDEITETFPDGTTRTFEVTPIVPGDHAWRWSDEAATRYRIHTIEITAPE
ncbi:MAG: hypothetical protein R3B90_21740 [Planctomycetaceae bacterium]